MKIRLSLQLLSAAVITMLCSCATEYQSIGPNGGYQSERLSTNEFIVEYFGDGSTSKKETDDFALLRASEITTEYAFKYFTIEAEKDLSVAKVYNYGTTTRTRGKERSSYRGVKYSEVSTTKPNIRRTYRPGSRLKIKCYTAKPNNKHLGRIYNAQQMAFKIRTFYELKPSF